jgi:uncharacterized protein YcfJ
MSTLRAVGSGMACALFAGLGGFVGAQIGESRGASLDTVVGGTILGGATGALLVGLLAGSQSCPNCPTTQVALIHDPRFP